MKKILLIEDDELFGKIYSDLLSQEAGYSVEWVTDGETGYRKMVEGGWSLVLLDSLLPKLNAVDVLNKLKQAHPEKFTQNTLIITNLENGKMMEDLKSFGLEVLIKSEMTPDQFITRVKTFFSEHADTGR